MRRLSRAGDAERRKSSCQNSRYNNDFRRDFATHLGFGEAGPECGGSQKLECPLCNGRGTIYAYKGG